MIENFLESLKAKGWKQKAIAEKCKIAPSFISELAKGDTCGIETVIKIADAFGVSTDEVLGRAPSQPRSPIIDRIEQIAGDDEEIAREALRCAEDKKLIKEVRGEKGRGRNAA